jgi:multiple sugar transport system permease protein
MDYTRVSRGPYGKRPYGRFLNYLFLSIVAAVCIMPILWLVYTSFKPRMLTFASPPVWVKFKPTLENYRRVIQEKNLLQPLLNSVIIVTSSTAVTIAVGSFAAYIFSRYRKRWIRPTLFVILTTNMIPPAVIILPIFLFARAFGLYDTRVMMIIVYTAYNLAFVIWMLRSFFLDIPAEIEESALIDGCGRLGVVFRIVLPLSAPAIAATAILAFIFAWNEFIIALVLTSKTAFTLPILATGLISAKGVMWGEMTATTAFITIPEVIFIMFAQKYIVRGLTMGAIKG